LSECTLIARVSIGEFDSQETQILWSKCSAGHDFPGEHMCTSSSALQVACYPSVICWCICSAFVGDKWRGLGGSSHTVLGYTLLRAILGAGALVLYYLSIEYLPLKDAGMLST